MADLDRLQATADALVAELRRTRFWRNVWFSLTWFWVALFWLSRIVA